MEVAYTQKAKEDISFWKSMGNKQIMAKISNLISSILENPYDGIGKPEPLKYIFTGLWSHRINQEHRIIYEVLDDKIVIHSLKGHYF